MSGPGGCSGVGGVVCLVWGGGVPGPGGVVCLVRGGSASVPCGIPPPPSL